MNNPYYQEPGIQLNQCSNPKGMKGETYEN